MCVSIIIIIIILVIIIIIIIIIKIIKKGKYKKCDLVNFNVTETENPL